MILFLLAIMLFAWATASSREFLSLRGCARRAPQWFDRALHVHIPPTPDEHTNSFHLSGLTCAADSTYLVARQPFICFAA